MEEIERALQEPERWWAVLANRYRGRQAQAEKVAAELKTLQEGLEEVQRVYDNVLDLYNCGRIDHRPFDQRKLAYAARVHEPEGDPSVAAEVADGRPPKASGEAELVTYLQKARQA